MSNWDPLKHPRHQKGSAQGGQFAAGTANARRTRMIKELMAKRKSAEKSSFGGDSLDRRAAEVDRLKKLK